MPRSSWLKQALSISLLAAPTALSALTALSACGFGGGDGDAEEDCAFTFRELCGLGFKGDRTFGDETIETTGAACTEVVPATTGMPELCVISGANLIIPSNKTVAAIGTRPLVLAATGNVRIEGTLTVSSKLGAGTAEVLGAGATTFRCDSYAAAPGASATGGAGGAGASLRGAGGNGAKGSVGLPGQTAGGEALAIVDAAKLTALHGGCRGQDGGDAATPSSGGFGGPPGGVVYLAAKGSVQISMGGSVAANGAGGHGGGLLAGGGGGGSGGMIIIEAPQVIHLGALSANGGGGGEGGSATVAGAPGEDGGVGSAAAKGGDAADPTGNGGAGGARDFAAAGPGAESSGGGGGGGGGVGLIRVIAPKLAGGGLTSPPRD